MSNRSQRQATVNMNSVKPTPKPMKSSRSSNDKVGNLDYRSEFITGSGPTPPITTKYNLGDLLGSGQYGTARMATEKRTGNKYAVKTMNKSRFRNTDIPYHFECMRSEISILRRVDHPNIIRLQDVFETEDELFLVMELCTGGELFDRIKSKRFYSEKEAQLVLKQVIEAVAALHVLKIAHCDLKPDNFLFVNRDEHSPIKIIDFGMSKALAQREYLKHLRGTPYYIAPEVLDGQYSEHCDMWSVGVIMFVMLFGFPPFFGDSDPVIFNKIRAGFDPVVKSGWGAWFPKDANISASARDLISKLLTKDVSARLTAKEALDHPWIQGKDVPLHPLPKEIIVNLHSFVKRTNFSNAMLCYLTQSSMSTQEYIALAKTFRYIDTNNDGTLSMDEFKTALQATEGHLDERTLQRAVELADIDGDGTISWKELLLATTARRLAAKEERLWTSFKNLDLNNDGKLSVDELKMAFGKESEEITKMIKEVDKNYDGFVDYNEFLSMFNMYEGKVHQQFL